MREITRLSLGGGKGYRYHILEWVWLGGAWISAKSSNRSEYTVKSQSQHAFSFPSFLLISPKLRLFNPCSPQPRLTTHPASSMKPALLLQLLLLIPLAPHPVSASLKQNIMSRCWGPPQEREEAPVGGVWGPIHGRTSWENTICSSPDFVVIKI